MAASSWFERLEVYGSRFRIQGLGFSFGVWGVGFRRSSSSFSIWRDCAIARSASSCVWLTVEGGRGGGREGGGMVGGRQGSGLKVQALEFREQV